MLKQRLIPTLLLQNGQIVKSIGFKEYQVIGNPQVAIRFFNAWAVDEIIFLDITKNQDYTSRVRTDYNFKPLESFAEIVAACAKTCFVPLSVGGGIKTIEQMKIYIKAGADKIVINSEGVRRPELITQAAELFGRQAVIVSIDAKTNAAGAHEVFINFGQTPTGLVAADWAIEAEKRGAGEIFLTSIDQDGRLSGYDLTLLKSVTARVKIPVIASGGIGSWPDLVDGITVGGAAAVAAANIFHFKEQSTRDAKKYMTDAGLNVRISTHN